MGEEKNVQDNTPQTGQGYYDAGPGYGYRGNEHYQHNRSYPPYMNDQNYGYQNMGRGASVNNRPYYGMREPYHRGYEGRYYDGPGYGRGYKGYGAPYGHYDDHEYKYEYKNEYKYDDKYDEHGYYGMPYQPYARPYMNRRFWGGGGRHGGPYGYHGPNMRKYWDDDHYEHHYYHHGYPYEMAYQKPGGLLRSWLSYNPVTNWVGGPQGTSFLRGLGVATAGIILAPAVIKTLRPLAVQAVHGAMSIVGELKGVVADAREELEDIFADAKWENLNDKEGQRQEGI